MDVRMRCHTVEIYVDVISTSLISTCMTVQFAMQRCPWGHLLLSQYLLDPTCPECVTPLHGLHGSCQAL